MKNRKGILLSIVIIAMVALIFGVIILSGKKEKPVDKKELEQDVKKELSLKVDYLTFGSTSKDKKFEKHKYSDFRNLVGVNVTNELRLQIALSSLDKKFKKVKDLSKVNKIVDVSDAKEVEEIELSNVKERYLDLFGESLGQFNNVDGCPKYYYDQDNKVYYKVVNCEVEKNDDYLLTYKSHYATAGAATSIYVSYAVISTDEQHPERYNIFSNFDRDKYAAGFIEKEEMLDFKITSKNYKEFTEIKYTFVKGDNGKYHVTLIEQIR